MIWPGVINSLLFLFQFRDEEEDVPLVGMSCERQRKDPESCCSAWEDVNLGNPWE